MRNGSLPQRSRGFAGLYPLLAWVLLLGAGIGVASDTASRPAADRAVIIPVQGEITEITQDSIERRLDRAREEHIPLVIFELDTPGGALGPTLDICHAIKAARDRGIRTYAWINSQAYSAGTIIALATDGIYMTGNATIGDCKPIVMTPEGAKGLAKDIEAKAMSPLLAELRDSARRNGYDMTMMMALVREMQVFWVVNTETGERRFVDTSTRDELFGLTASRPAGDSIVRSEPVPDSLSGGPWKYVQSAPPLNTVTQPIMTDRELLTMRTAEAIAYGFAQGKIPDEASLSSSLNITGPVERLDNTWVEWVVTWLASPVVRGVLFLLILLGAYAEFQHPGLGLPGAVAIVSLLLFLGAPYVAGFTVTWEIVVILLGVALLAVEIFVLPGFGVAGVTGLILLGVGLISSFVPAEPGFGHWPHWPRLPSSFTYLKNGLWALASGSLGAVIGAAVLARYLPRVPVAGRLVAPNPTREQITMDDPYEGFARVGDIGRTEGPLRPAGKARFGAMMVDVVSEGEYIDKNVRVEVVEHSGNRVVVRRVD